MLSGLGATETAPSVTFTSPDTERAGVIGLPAAGNLLKLTPMADKLELRVKGPNVTPGYWRNPELTAAAFDEEGYFRLGDAVRLLDAADATRGLVFDGRISEDFKLASGTWVSAGPLRTALLAALGPLAQDVVIAGLNRDYIAVLIFPDLKASDASVSTQVRERLAAHARANPANAAHVERAILLSEPPSLDHGEITDKGSINQRAVLQRRATLVEELYRSDPPPHVITI
jgi:feruloyl-CoA synthase